MRSVRDYQLAHPWKETDRNWIRATYYTGMMGLYRTTGDPEIPAQSRRWAQKHEWAEGNERERANKKTCEFPEELQKDLQIAQPAIPGSA
jgi:hypothetical protein